MQTVNLSLEIILYIVLGFVVRRLKVVDADFTKTLGKLMINLLIPCMILKALQLDFSHDELKSSLILILLGLGFVLLVIGGGHVVYLLGGRRFSGKLFRFSMAFPNYTYLGLPVMDALYGDTGVFYFVMLTISVRVLFYPLSKPMLSQDSKRDERSSGRKLRDFITAPAVAVVVGLALFLTGLRLPGVLYSCVSDLGSCCSPFGMMLSGMVLAQYSMSCLKHPRLYVIPLIKLFVVPAVALGVALLLRLDAMTSRSLIIFAALPVASMISIFTVMYSDSKEAELLASSSVLISTVLCSCTIPLWVAIMDAALPAL